MLKNSRTKISNLAKNTPKYFYEIFIFTKQYFFSAKTGKRSRKNEVSSSRECIIPQNNMLKLSNMFKVIRQPPRISLDPLKGLQCLQDHQLSFLITILSRPVLEHEGMGAIFLKKGKIREKQDKN